MENNIDDTTYDVVNSTSVVDSSTPNVSVVDSSTPNVSVVESSTPNSSPLNGPSDQPNLQHLTFLLNSLLGGGVNKNNDNVNDNGDIMSTLLRGMMQQFLQGGMNLGNEEEDDADDENEEEEDDENEDDEEEDDEEDDEDEDEDEDEDDEEDEDEEEEDEDEDVVDPNNIYVIKCDDKLFYTDTLKRAKKCMVQKFYIFLQRNKNSFIRMEKDELSITAFERQPNTLLPYQETQVFYISISKVEKVNEL